jgi:hypothetical protein
MSFATPLGFYTQPPTGVPPMPPGECNPWAWANAWQQKWIHDPSLPLTLVHVPESVILSPPCDPGRSIAFPRRMIACPLTVNGPPGSVPNGHSNWWNLYFNSASTGAQKRAWVQGHLLNHNLHGPGTDENLVPITDSLNRIMEKWAEKVVKECVNRRMILRYEVIVHWDAGKRPGTDHDWMNNAAKHPSAMHQAYGDEIRRGECLAPTSLEWHCWQIAWLNNTWNPVKEIAFNGFEGFERHIYPNQWDQ